MKKIFQRLSKTWVETSFEQGYKRELKRYKLKTIINKKYFSTKRTKLYSMMYSTFHFMEKFPGSRVQIMFWVRTSLRELHGLHTMTSSFKLYWVRKCCLESETLKLRCKKRLMREHRMRKYKRCPCKGQESSRFIKKCFIWKKKSEITGH